MSNRKKILWLASWYPNRKDLFDGDFIQRHARAAAIFNDIHVIFVKGDEELLIEKEHELWQATGLVEQVIYYRKKLGAIGALYNYFSWKKTIRKAIDEYIVQHGAPDLVHVHVPWKAGLAALYLNKKYGIPFLVSEHWGIYTRHLEGNISQKPFYYNYYIKKIFRQASAVITVSDFLGRSLIEYGAIKKFTVIPNVVDTTLFFPRKEKYECFSFIHVSNLEPVKNADLILRAFARYLQEGVEDAQLIFVGNRNDELKKMADALGMLNRVVFFRGEISYREVAEEMGRNHCLVMFSQSETFSCVTAEALSSGIPVIASAAGALPELVNENNGILVEPGNLEKLVNAMHIVRDNPNFQPVTISSDAAASFGYPLIAEKFRQLYEGFISRLHSEERK